MLRKERLLAFCAERLSKRKKRKRKLKLFEWLFKKDKGEEQHDLIINRLSELSERIEKNDEMKKLLFNDEQGTTTIEYAMMVVFIACVAVLGFELLGVSVKSLFEVANSLLQK